MRTDSPDSRPNLSSNVTPPNNQPGIGENQAHPEPLVEKTQQVTQRLAQSDNEEGEARFREGVRAKEKVFKASTWTKTKETLQAAVTKVKNAIVSSELGLRIAMKHGSHPSHRMSFKELSDKRFELITKETQLERQKGAGLSTAATRDEIGKLRDEIREQEVQLHRDYGKDASSVMTRAKEVAEKRTALEKYQTSLSGELDVSDEIGLQGILRDLADNKQLMVANERAVSRSKEKTATPNNANQRELTLLEVQQEMSSDYETLMLELVKGAVPILERSIKLKIAEFGKLNEKVENYDRHVQLNQERLQRGLAQKELSESEAIKQIDPETASHAADEILTNLESLLNDLRLINDTAGFSIKGQHDKKISEYEQAVIVLKRDKEKLVESSADLKLAEADKTHETSSESETELSTSTQSNSTLIQDKDTVIKSLEVRIEVLDALIKEKMSQLEGLDSKVVAKKINKENVKNTIETLVSAIKNLSQKQFELKQQIIHPQREELISERVRLINNGFATDSPAIKWIDRKLKVFIFQAQLNIKELKCIGARADLLKQNLIPTNLFYRNSLVEVITKLENTIATFRDEIAKLLNETQVRENIEETISDLRMISDKLKQEIFTLEEANPFLSEEIGTNLSDIQKDTLVKYYQLLQKKGDYKLEIIRLEKLKLAVVEEVSAQAEIHDTEMSSPEDDELAESLEELNDNEKTLNYNLQQIDALNDETSELEREHPFLLDREFKGTTPEEIALKKDYDKKVSDLTIKSTLQEVLREIHSSLQEAIDEKLDSLQANVDQKMADLEHLSNQVANGEIDHQSALSTAETLVKDIKGTAKTLFDSKFQLNRQTKKEIDEERALLIGDGAESHGPLIQPLDLKLEILSHETQILILSLKRTNAKAVFLKAHLDPNGSTRQEFLTYDIGKYDTVIDRHHKEIARLTAEIERVTQ